MKSTVLFIASTLALSLLLQPAVAVEGGGPASMRIGETEVAKNGFGSRSKMTLSLYECSLYLPQRSNDATTIVASNQPMAVRIEITSRFVSQAKMLSALNDGFQASTGGNAAVIAPQIKEFGQCFSDPIQMGDVFVFAYTPNTGVVVSKNNQQKGVIGGLEFKQALMGIWLGNNPVDANLRTAMLGQSNLR